MNTNRNSKLILSVVLAISISGCGTGGTNSSEKNVASNSNSGQNGAAPSQTTCSDATSRLQAEHARLKTCDSDADCNYVDGFYDIVARLDTGRFVTTFNCTAVTPFLVVANGSELEGNRNFLTQLQQEQEQACARPEGTVTCLALDGFTSTTPPVCTRNKCQTTVEHD